MKCPALVIIFLALCSCATKVECPRSNGLPNAALLDHGRHSTLVLSAGQGKMIRYAYGDWSYYALAKMGVFSGARALLWPSESALGRMELSGPVERQNILNSIPVLVHELYLFQVNENSLKRVRDQLEKIFLENSETKIYNKRYGLDFVQLPESYHVFHNSNQEIAKWMEGLGCEVDGTGLLSTWEVLKKP